MSDFATFTLCGTVSSEPKELSHFSTGCTYDAKRFSVRICKPARDGSKATVENVEIDAWGNVQQQLSGAHVGCAVLVHGAVCARVTQQGRSWLSLRASAVRVLGGSDRVSPSAPLPAEAQLADEDIPF